MVVSNLGSIILALPSASAAPDPGATTANVARAVRTLALANTLSRLAVGPLADALAPVAARGPDGVWAFSRARATSRVAFVAGAALLLTGTCAWLAGAVNSPTSLRQKAGGGAAGVKARRRSRAAITSFVESTISRPERWGTPDTVVVACRSHQAASFSSAAAARTADFFPRGHPLLALPLLITRSA